VNCDNIFDEYLLAFELSDIQQQHKSKGHFTLTDWILFRKTKADASNYFTDQHTFLQYKECMRDKIASIREKRPKKKIQLAQKIFELFPKIDHPEKGAGEQCIPQAAFLALMSFICGDEQDAQRQ
jgi:hypothetical protein